MQMAMPGPGHFGMAPFRPPGVPMGPPAARPPGADLDALLSKPTVQGRARTERYIIQSWLLRLHFKHVLQLDILPMLLGSLL